MINAMSRLDACSIGFEAFGVRVAVAVPAEAADRLAPALPPDRLAVGQPGAPIDAGGAIDGGFVRARRRMVERDLVTRLQLRPVARDQDLDREAVALVDRAHGWRDRKRSTGLVRGALAGGSVIALVRGGEKRRRE